MKKIAVWLLVSTFALSAFPIFGATSVLFPLNSLFNGSRYAGSMTISSVNTFLADSNAFYLGTQTVVPVSAASNPVVLLQPNQYQVSFSGVTKTMRITVPADTNTLNALNLTTNVPTFLLAPASSTGQNAITNLVGYEGLVVLPFTNLTANITNSAKYFGPWLGSNYVQLAVNATGGSSNKSSVGGGKIYVVGVNYMPAPLIITNSTGGITSLEIESPAFSQGALVCVTNPCIRCIQNGSADITLALRKLTIASLDNHPTNLLELTSGYPRMFITDNWCGPWAGLTNNQVNGVHGMVTPSTRPGVSKYNLQILINGSLSDKIVVSGNNFLGMSGIFWSPDHGDFTGNQFSFCGLPNDWPTNSPQALGAALILAPQVDDDWNFLNNFFYATTAEYFIGRGFGAGGELQKSMNDYYEGVTYSVIYSNTVPHATFTQLAAYGFVGDPDLIECNSNYTILPATEAPAFNVQLAGDPAQFPGGLSVFSGQARLLLTGTNISLTATNTLTVTNTLSGAGLAGVNGPFSPYSTSPMSVLSTNGNYRMQDESQNVDGYPLEIDSPDTATDYYFSTNGTTWFSTSPTYNPPPSGLISDSFTVLPVFIPSLKSIPAAQLAGTVPLTALPPLVITNVIFTNTATVMVIGNVALVGTNWADMAGIGAAKALQATNGLANGAFTGTNKFDMAGKGAADALAATNNFKAEMIPSGTLGPGVIAQTFPTILATSSGFLSCLLQGPAGTINYSPGVGPSNSVDFYASGRIVAGSGLYGSAANLTGALPLNVLPVAVITNGTGTVVSNNLVSVNGGQVTGAIPLASLPAGAVTNNQSGTLNLNSVNVTNQLNVASLHVTNNSTIMEGDLNLGVSHTLYWGTPNPSQGGISSAGGPGNLVMSFFGYNAGTYTISSVNFNTTNLNVIGSINARGLTVTNAPVLILTNAAPSNVTIGTTAPDLWVTITNSGNQYFMPVWKTH